MSGTRDVKKTEAGKDYQIEMLTKRTTRLKKNLASEIGVFEVLTQNGEPEMVRQALTKMDETFAEFSSVSSRLSVLVTEEQAAVLNSTVLMEGESVSRVGAAARNWLAEQEKLESKSGTSERSWRSNQSRKTSEVKQKESGGGKPNNMELTVHLMRKHDSFEKQLNRFEDLLRVGDVPTIKREIEELQKLYYDLYYEKVYCSTRGC